MPDRPVTPEAILKDYPKIVAWLKTLSLSNELALEIAAMLKAIADANRLSNYRRSEVARLQKELAYITALACVCDDSRYTRCSVHPTPKPTPEESLVP